jgi:hypothetical protein
MGYAAAEFAATLGRVFAAWQVLVEGEHAWRIRGDDVDVRLQVAPQPPRRLGALVLPVLRLQIDFLRADAAGRERFLSRFERGFHKAGG